MTYTNNKRNGLTYDVAGNLINDIGLNYTFDGTGQQATASYSGYLLQQYYDGDGLRAKKIENVGCSTNRRSRATMPLVTKTSKRCLPCVLIIVVAGLSSCKETQSRLNEVGAQSSMRLIRKAEITYRANNQNRFGTLQELHSAGLIDAELASGTKRGYRYDVSVGKESYAVTAVPVEYDVTGSWSFHVDESGVIRGSPTKGRTAGIKDRPVRYQ